MHVHIVGVSGTLMGSLAGLLVRLGHRVTGSDVRFYDPMGSALERWGVECREGFRPEHLEPQPDCVVIGNVCRPDNPEARAAIDGGMRYLHVADAVREFALTNTRTLVVAGTHGKTTTTAIAAYLLDACGRSPGFLIGGVPLNFDQSFRVAASAPKRLPTWSAMGAAPVPVPSTPSGPAQGHVAPPLSPFVIEGDEYDTAFFEKTPKFIHYDAQVATLSSIEHDHVDIYPRFSDYREAFRRFVDGLPSDGLLVANAMDPEVVDLVEATASCEVAWYSVDGGPVRAHALRQHRMPPCAWHAAPSAVDERGTLFDLFVGGAAAGRWHLPMVGRYNVANAMAAIAACAQGYGVGLDDLRRALSDFRGIKRRQELCAEVGGVRVYDDFAHHPSAVAETLAGLRARHPEARLFVAFEPRSATACRSLHQDEYPGAFREAHVVYLAPLGRVNIPETERLNLRSIAEGLAQAGVTAHADIEVADIVSDVRQHARPGDVVVVLSNGDFGGIHQKLVRALG